MTNFYKDMRIIVILSAIIMGLGISPGISQEHRIRSNLRKLQATLICTQDVMECEDGSFVSRDPLNNCKFEECPIMKACTRDLFPCPDGTMVGRNAYNNCKFFECPNTGLVCAADVMECEDGSYVSRDPYNNCEFKACP